MRDHEDDEDGEEEETEEEKVVETEEVEKDEDCAADLEVDDPEPPAQLVQVLDLLDVQLVEGHLRGKDQDIQHKKTQKKSSSRVNICRPFTSSRS